MSDSGTVAAAPPEDIDALRGTVERLIQAGDLETVGVGAADFNGIFRGKHLPAEIFLQRIASPMAIGDMLFALDTVDGVVEEGPAQGWWPIGDRGMREMRCTPIPGTFRLVPWRHKTAVVLCDFAFTDGTPVDVAPRRVLERVIERARALGLEPQIGYELEFYVFGETVRTATGKGFKGLDPYGPRQAWSMVRAGVDDGLLRLLRDGLRRFGIPVEAWSVEGGAGQYEINVPYAGALEAADRAFLHRFAIKELVESDGSLATFMARPPGAAYGSSMHLHASLWGEDGTNAMSDPEGELKLSTTARRFIAGQLDAQHELTALIAPNVNSYKRLLPGMSSGATATWALENWSAAVRVISTTPASTRVEFRTPGADANPYLAIAAALAAGLSGIERELEPPPVATGLADEQDGARRVPASLWDAVGALEKSAIARDHLGDDFVEIYLATRRGELAAFQSAVTDWEAERYLLAL